MSSTSPFCPEERARTPVRGGPLSRRGLLTGLAGGLGLAVLSGGIRAEGALRLDAERRRALAALPLLRGQPGHGARLTGRPVVLTFFASWCPPCHAEFDNLNRLHAARGPEAVEIVAINAFEDFLPKPGGLEAFLEKKAPAYTVLGGGEAVTGLFGGVERIPTLFVFGSGGELVLRFVHLTGAKKTHVELAEIEHALDSTN